MKDFRYTAKFESEARFCLNKWREVKASNELFATSSLDDLRSLLPTDDEIEDNPDLLYTAMNAAVVNLINANDHGIATETALAVSKYFKNKHMNVEHDKYDIVGHIISQGYSTFGDNKAISADELEGTKDPFNITLGSVVYRYARQWFAEILEESADTKSDLYRVISGSWEIAYNDFDIAMGSKKLADAEMVTDEAQVKELSQYLRTEGGSGFMPDGTPVYTVIKGDARPTGCAFTSNPAAAVKGLMSASKDDEPQANLEEIVLQVRKDQQEVAASVKDIQEKIEESSSQEHKKTVIKTSMKKIEKIEDITPDFLKEAEASYVRDFITTEISKKGKEYMQELEAKDQAIADAEEAQANAEKAKADSEEELSKVSKKVEELEEAIAKRDEEEAFASRMEDLETKFELSDEQREIIASDIKGLSDEEFEAYEKKVSVFASKKSDEKKDEKSDEASGDSGSDADELKNLKEDKGSDVPNSLNADETEETFAQKANKTLKSVLSIK